LRACNLCPVSETLWVDEIVSKRRPFVAELLKRDTSGYNPETPQTADGARPKAAGRSVFAS